MTSTPTETPTSPPNEPLHGDAPIPESNTPKVESRSRLEKIRKNIKWLGAGALVLAIAVGSTIIAFQSESTRSRQRQDNETNLIDSLRNGRRAPTLSDVVIVLHPGATLYEQPEKSKKNSLLGIRYGDSNVAQTVEPGKRDYVINPVPWKDDAGDKWYGFYSSVSDAHPPKTSSTATTIPSKIVSNKYVWFDATAQADKMEIRTLDGTSASNTLPGVMSGDGVMTIRGGDAHEPAAFDLSVPKSLSDNIDRIAGYKKPTENTQPTDNAG